VPAALVGPVWFVAIGMVVFVTPAVSVTFFRPEFDGFLYALIGADKNEMPLSVLSALARLDVDPWEEAAELSALPKDTAVQRLAASIARLPGGRWTRADAKPIADRLIELLPRRNGSTMRPADKAHGLHGTTGFTVARLLLCAALGATALLLFAANREPSARDDRGDAPAYSTASPPQTSVPSR
jgi:hypothetical protein